MQLNTKAILPSLEIKRTNHILTTTVLGVLGWFLFTTTWYLVAKANLFPPQLLPSPLEVLKALFNLLVHENFAADILRSVTRIFSSFLFATLFAVPVGVLMGAFPSISALLNPVISPLRYLPAPSFVPLLLMWFGTGENQKIALLFLGVVWFIVTLVADNVTAVRLELVETARTLGAGRRNILKTIIFPSALPDIVDTLRQMLAVSWTYLVIAEIVATTDGIGAMMMRARRFVQVDEIMAGILTIGILGFLFDSLIRLVHYKCFPYLYRGKR